MVASSFPVAMRAGQSVNDRLPGELIDHGKGIAVSV